MRPVNNVTHKIATALSRDVSVSAVVAGFLSALINFAGPFLIVLEATRAAGLNEAQTASWIWALCIGNGVCGAALSLLTRIPVVVAWSTPGAALLIASLGGFTFSEAVGAFIVASVAAAIAGFTGWFGWLLSKVPASVLQALLAGILLPFVIAAGASFASAPLIAGAILLTFFVGKRFFDRYAVLGALVVGVAMTWATGSFHAMSTSMTLGGPVFTAPTFTLEALVSVALPLFIVTMASQNAPGLALLHSEGYQPNDRVLVGTISTASAALAPFGAHGINLGAITAAIAVGPESHPDRSRRYIASITGAVTYAIIGTFGGVLVAAFQTLPSATVSTIAAVALLGSTLTALKGAMGSGDNRTSLAALTTLAVTMSGLVMLNIGAAFWGLVAGALVYAVMSPRFGGAPRAMDQMSSTTHVASKGRAHKSRASQRKRKERVLTGV